jgi:hypothetical protein
MNRGLPQASGAEGQRETYSLVAWAVL